MDSPVLWGLKAEECSMNRKLIFPCVFALTLSIGAWAQGGVFQRGDVDEISNGNNSASNQSMLLRNGETSTTLSNQTFGNPNGADLTNQTFGAPLGSGLLIMLLAGAGYFTMKSNKKNNENQQ